MNKLAIIDWGIGGLGIYRLIKKQFGSVGLVYFSDTGATPYGKMSRDDLIDRLNLVLDFLRARSVAHVIVGCNAASTVIPQLGDIGMGISGIIDPAISKTLSMRPQQLGLIAGRRTVLSGVYRRAFASLGMKVDQRIAQPLSGMIESGNIHSDEIERAAKRILKPIRNSSHILLACTHYSAIQALLETLVSSDTVFIDPADTLVESISRLIPHDGGVDDFFTTGDPVAMKNSALSVFGVAITSPHRINIK